MSETLGRGDVQRPVDATEMSHRIEPFQGGDGGGSSGRQDQRRERNSRSRSDPEDQVEISEAAREALRRAERGADLMKY